MNTRPVRMGECVEILPGYAFKACARHDPSGSHQVIIGKHLPDPGVGYRYHPSHELRVTPRGKIARYVVKAGDVLLISRGAKNHATLVEDIPKRTVASATFYLLRMRNGVDGAYFTWFLNQSPTQHRIRLARTTAGTPILQRRVFVDIVIFLPSLADQRKIAALGACMVNERLLQQTLIHRTERLHALIGQRLVRNLI
uniref:Type I restriction modification DNA specificity domain-containing protein n=1 Tax=Candidatus Kentrum eta TaxID=2126337 RepID=A0A450V7M1_9GAMM|nr:MAG: hypothetical protein BECKH772A_GA0070896_100541 [Candidatus Kentron sp. H]VFJ94169.1 MAG: hypothetical protein BECKH772B_GA0070898_1005615 [Candidatus Kentron sp. H]VFK00749.1 MAG: hypothetical protein BECKH772C_GA0070978_100521 [Candidatus Kentron sp. H]